MTKKISIYYTNFNQFSLSNTKKIGKNSQTNSKRISNIENFKIKQKLLELPSIDDTWKNNEIVNNFDSDKRGWAQKIKF